TTPRSSVHASDCAMVVWVLGGAAPTTPKPKDTPVFSAVMPPSITHAEAGGLFHTSSRCVRLVMSARSRTRLKFEAARILARAIAFDRLRASPLSRKL